MTKEEIAKLLLIVSGAFPQTQTNETTLPTWAVILEKVPFEYAQKALLAYIAQGSPFAPTAGQILNSAREMRDGVAPPPEMALEMAVRGVENLHPRIKEVLKFVDISPLKPKQKEAYNPWASAPSSRDEMFAQDYARKAFLRAYKEGMDFVLKNQSRALADPERRLLADLKIKQIQ
jgi:hypothetical protein